VEVLADTPEWRTGPGHRHGDGELRPELRAKPQTFRRFLATKRN
jgi:hypothetical protein